MITAASRAVFSTWCALSLPPTKAGTYWVRDAPSCPPGDPPKTAPRMFVVTPHLQPVFHPFHSAGATSFRMRSSDQSHQRASKSSRILSSSKRNLITHAGFPATIAYGGTSFVTTLDAPMTEPCPTFTPDRIVTPAQIQTSFPMTTSPLVYGQPSSNLPVRFQRALKGNELTQ